MRKLREGSRVLFFEDAWLFPRPFPTEYSTVTQDISYSLYNIAQLAYGLEDVKNALAS